AIPPTIEIVGFLAPTVVMTDLRRNQKELQEANCQLSLLNNITRHDVANQIMVLRAYAMLLRSTFLTPYQSGMIDKIDHSAENIQTQMDFAKIYQNIGTKEATWIDLHDSIVKAKRSLNLGSIQVEERGTDCMVLADRMFEKVVYNLIENAIRHGEGTKQIVISVLERGEEMDLVFEDDGNGIPARDRPHLFERGFGKNTGLGLFISREILGITGLSIVEASKDGMGARFIIKAPAGAWRKR
ncbi:MAG: HAMP domain-containing sensor histidine kinase, partial [Methanomassiliicoccales archaeon]